MTARPEAGRHRAFTLQTNQRRRDPRRTGRANTKVASNCAFKLTQSCNKADRDLDRQHHFSAGDLLLFDDAAGKVVLQRNYRDLIWRRITIFRLLEPRAWASLKLR